MRLFPSRVLVKIKFYTNFFLTKLFFTRFFVCKNKFVDFLQKVFYFCYNFDANIFFSLNSLVRNIIFTTQCSTIFYKNLQKT